jgi:hypothetical protein
MSISSSSCAAPAPATPSLNDTVAILSEIWNTNAASPVILERIHAYVKTQLPQSIKNYQTAHAERETRKKSLELFADEFTESFLNRNKYFYSPHSELYFTYHNQVRYSLIHEDEIHHRILADITASDFLSATATTSTTKYRIKNKVIKSIQSSRDILSSIPESRTIQNIIGLLYPTLFHTRDHAKYFLTILGDVILKKTAPLIYFVPVLLKEFIKDLANECYALFGCTANSFSTAFKFKYYEHQYNDCRLVDIRGTQASSSAGFMLRLSNMPELRESIIDLFCVAAHYSHRFGSADDFLRLHCKTPEVSSHAWFLRDRSETQIIDEFMNYATEPASSDHEISMTNMMYLWKMYLSEFRLPSVFFAATLRAKLACIASPSSTPDIIPNRTSKYLPLVSQFRQFWSECCFTDDREIELEIDELSTLFNEYATPTSGSVAAASDTALLGMLRHFYPDVIIDDDKYILNVGCKLWDKPTEINDYLEQYKQQCLLNNLSFPQPLYNAYEYYCGRCYATVKRRIISKRYFEKYFMEEYADYIDENGMITIKWWMVGVTEDDYVDADADIHTLS